MTLTHTVALNVYDYRRYMDAFAQLGREWKVADGVLQVLEEFWCDLYGGNGKYTDIDKKRGDDLVSKIRALGDTLRENVEKGDPSGLYWERLPLPRVNLHERIKQANYQLALWKRAHEKKFEVPPPQDNHGCALSKHAA